LVATLGTRALADDGDSSSLDQAPSPQVQQSQSAAESQQLAALDPGGTDGDDRAVIGGDTRQGMSGEQTEPPVAQGQAEHPGEALVAGTDQPERDQQHGGPTGCAGDCSTRPPDPREPLVAAAPDGGGWLDRLRAWWSGGRQPSPRQEPAPPPRPDVDTPRPGTNPPQVPTLESVEFDIRTVEEVQEARAKVPSPIETGMGTEESYLGRASQDLAWLRTQFPEGTEERTQLEAKAHRLNAAIAVFWEGPGSPIGQINMQLGQLNRQLQAQIASRQPAEPAVNDQVQAQLGQVGERVAQLQPPAPEGTREAREFARQHAAITRHLAELTRMAGQVQRLSGGDNPMSIAQVDPPGTSSGQATTHDQRPVLPPLPAGGATPSPGIPPTLAADLRALGVPDLSDSLQPGVVVKPVPPSQQAQAPGVLTTERSPLQQAALDGLRNTIIAGTSLSLLTTLLYQLGYLAVGGVMYLPGSRPPWAPSTPTQG